MNYFEAAYALCIAGSFVFLLYYFGEYKMELVAAPSRQFKTWSMWVLIGIAVINAAIPIINQLHGANFIGPGTFAILNTGLGFLGVVAKLISQKISVTTDQKIELVESMAKAPVKKGQADIDVQVISSNGNSRFTNHADDVRLP